MNYYDEKNNLINKLDVDVKNIINKYGLSIKNDLFKSVKLTLFSDETQYCYECGTNVEDDKDIICYDCFKSEINKKEKEIENLEFDISILDDKIIELENKIKKLQDNK